MAVAAVEGKVKHLNAKEVFGWTPEYLTRNGRPWFPVMGEFHYSRYPDRYWEESLYKMKACGVDVVSTYVIWIHHEEEEGRYDFTGCRNLRKFLAAADKCGVLIFLRIGPWCHGEVRNGGFPDWLLQKEYEPRTNDERYFACVEAYYNRVFEEVQGYLLKDGGPIIGVQIENEYGHCGGLQAEDGEAHMRRLKELAVKAGFEVPYYTATGWGGAATGGLLPVLGGYCDAPWDPRITEIEPSVNYVFTRERNDRNIGSDQRKGEDLAWSCDKFPYLTAELGGGIQVTKHRRPVASNRDIGAMTLTKLGCGANLLGYYMYHGGTNPHGKRSTLQESRETGYPNDLPEYSYDFNAPIREYGQISDTALELKLYAMFLHDFGEEFCRMDTYLMEENPEDPNDVSRLRTAIRRNGSSGYLFVNNYQRRKKLAEHNAVTLKAELPGECIQFGAQDIHDGDYFFYPFHFPIGENAELLCANATPLCVLHRGDGNRYCFYGKDPDFKVTGEPGKNELVCLSRQEALHSWKIESGGEEHLLICGYPVIKREQGYDILYRPKANETVEFAAYPELAQSPEGFEKSRTEGIYTVYTMSNSPKPQPLRCKMTEYRDADSTRYEVEIEYDGIYREQGFFGGRIPEDVFLKLDYTGESLELFINGTKEGDHFYTGQLWEIGLKRFDFPEKVELVIHRLDRNMPVYIETWPDLPDGGEAVVNTLTAEKEYRIPLQLA